MLKQEPGSSGEKTITQAQYFISNQAVTPERPAPGLYLVATPIGNLRDITLRALDILAAADLVLCEDTRHSAKLFDAYGIRTPRTAFHEHNERARIEAILDRLREGAVIALVSDAGTPLLSDPGFPLVRAARDADLPVFPVPGPSALLAALTGAGLPTDAFLFAGFLPPKTGQRKNALSGFQRQAQTLIFYESPRRLAASLADMAEVFGGARKAVVALELTKKFERFASGTLEALAAQFDEGETKGEAVIVVAGDDGTGAADPAQWQDELERLMETMALREAVDAIAQAHGLKRKQVYNEALALKARNG
ncbi:16S rRNA (cytidine(1402)-2'-O)-methyltransferase [Pelagibacterium lentulum]|uniref:Ribosomal RNA small subunit methyltransferase I n=1 Tax=Pelagibacterium lentulum TaxID=2029865 RepID=A0A916R6H9_9HYPH|nr:16S rRNA (cytidine(1402)-2'-O)-methyltransferase [Pelagibacterium lentulum]GGA37716.1 ribosomal RNA small subunit methyltransferase I [Pelagibacterium lentulum]